MKSTEASKGDDGQEHLGLRSGTDKASIYTSIKIQVSDRSEIAKRHSLVTRLECFTEDGPSKQGLDQMEETSPNEETAINVILPEKQMNSIQESEYCTSKSSKILKTLSVVAPEEDFPETEELNANHVAERDLNEASVHVHGHKESLKTDYEDGNVPAPLHRREAGNSKISKTLPLVAGENDFIESKASTSNHIADLGLIQASLHVSGIRASSMRGDDDSDVPAPFNHTVLDDVERQSTKAADHDDGASNNAAKHWTLGWCRCMSDEEIIAEAAKRKLIVHASGKPYSWWNTSFGSLLISQLHVFDYNSIIPELGAETTCYFNLLRIYGCTFLFFGLCSLPYMITAAICGEAGATHLAETTSSNLEDFICREGSQTKIKKFVLRYGVLSNIIFSLVFVLVFFYTRKYFSQVSKMFGLPVQKLEDYSLVLRGIPLTVTYAELKDYLEKLVRDEIYPLLTEEERADLSPEENPIHDIQMIFHMSETFEIATKHSELIRKAQKWTGLLNAGSQKRYFLSWRGWRNVDEHLHQAVQDLEAFNKVAHQNCLHDDQVFQIAYVTFTSTLMCTKMLRFNYGYNVVAMRAPPPEEIKWENIELERFWFMKYSQMFIIVLGAFVLNRFLRLLIYLNANVIIIADDSFPNPSGNIQPSDLIANFNLTSEHQCINATELIGTTNFTEEIDRHEECLNLSNSKIKDGTDSLCSYLWICKCLELYEKEEFAQLIDIPVCRDLFGDVIKGYLLPLLVVGFNMIVVSFAGRLQTAQLTVTKLSQEFETFSLSLILTFANIAIVNLLAVQRISGLGYTANWYNTFGTELFFLSLYNIFTSQLMPVSYFLVRLCYTSLKEEIFKITLRLSIATATVWFTMMYGPGIPMLYFTCAGYFFVSYAVDKFLVLNYFVKPQQQKSSLFLNTAHPLFLVGVFLNLLWTTVTLSSAESALVPSITNGSEYYDYYYYYNSYGEPIESTGYSLDPVNFIPMALVFLIVLPAGVLSFCYLGWISLNDLDLFFQGYTVEARGNYRKQRIERDYYYFRSYFEAEKKNTKRLRPDLLKIKSYNILANEEYRTKFYVKENVNIAEIHDTQNVIQALNIEEVTDKALAEAREAIREYRNSFMSEDLEAL